MRKLPKIAPPPPPPPPPPPATRRTNPITTLRARDFAEPPDLNVHKTTTADAAAASVASSKAKSGIRKT